ncbi:DUF6153 family protein [uncultured Microbacterium sp.]|uniref:DUF6153 family protein n=1 Tax=Microbacterium TaxID=33882 RepID=UPI001423E429|nr:DUF6153 family protein [uncultured Microbacterium sp.]NIG66388.1 hypothetical protein [Microbacterium sp. Be9]
MLISIARRVNDQRTLTRTLLTVVAVALSVIFGLLAMHSMNTHTMPSGHSETIAVAPAQADAHPAHASDEAAAVDEAGCATCSDDHGMAWMACVLALLIAVVLVARPSTWWRALTENPGTLLSRFAFRGALYPLRPPSLTVLCISRT